MSTVAKPPRPLAERLHYHRSAILDLARKYGAENVRVFGSVARGTERPDSDIDLLVHMQPRRSLLDMGGLLMDLRDLLGVEVDLVSDGGLRGAEGERIRAECLPLE
jgi:predicted nucleotidyltransferase